MFFDNYGLLNSRPDEVNAENSLLWTFEYVLLLEHLGLDSKAVKKDLNNAIDLCKTNRSGIYHQNPEFAINTPLISKDRYMSPDQLLAIVGFSYLNNLDHHKLIWKEIKSQGLRYDNVTPDKPTRYIHPKNLIFYGYLAGSLICKILLPLFLITCIIPFFRPTENTSTKILSYVYLKTIKNNNISIIVRKIINKSVIKRHKSWGNIFQIYFPDESHPTHQLVNLGNINV